MILAVVLLALAAASHAEAAHLSPKLEVQPVGVPDITCLIERSTKAAAGLSRDWVTGILAVSRTAAEVGMELAGCLVTQHDKPACLQQGLEGGWEAANQFVDLLVSLAREALGYVGEILKCLEASSSRRRIA